MIRTQITVGLLLTILAMVIVTLIGINENARLAHETEAQLARSIMRGAVLYQNNCVTCHAEQGQGIPGRCPPLNTPELFDTKTGRMAQTGWSGSLHDFIYSTIAQGRLRSTRPEEYRGNTGVLSPDAAAMPLWSQRYGGPMRDDQIEDITNFILNWSKAPGVLAEVAEPPAQTPEQRGKRLFASQGCAACHNVTTAAEGGLPCPNMGDMADVAATRVPGQSVEQYLRESIVNPNAFVVPGYQPGVMPQTFKDLPTDQIDALVAYLLTLKQE
jgi:mono/diheme cytochrome c family protein